MLITISRWRCPYYGYEEDSTEYEDLKQEYIEMILERKIATEMAWQEFQAGGGELTEEQNTLVQESFDENITTFEEQATTELETELGEDAKITQEQLDTKVDEIIIRTRVYKRSGNGVNFAGN